MSYHTLSCMHKLAYKTYEFSILGNFCQNDVDECASDPCVNGGTCVDTSEARYQCVCPDGYTGEDANVMQIFRNQIVNKCYLMQN